MSPPSQFYWTIDLVDFELFRPDASNSRKGPSKSIVIILRRSKRTCMYNLGEITMLGIGAIQESAGIKINYEFHMRRNPVVRPYFYLRVLGDGNGTARRMDQSVRATSGSKLHLT